MFEILKCLVPAEFIVNDSDRTKIFRVIEKIKAIKCNSSLKRKTLRENLLEEPFFDLETVVLILRKTTTNLESQVITLKNEINSLKIKLNRSNKSHAAKISNLKRAKKKFSKKTVRKSVSSSTQICDVSKDLIVSNYSESCNVSVWNLFSPKLVKSKKLKLLNFSRKRKIVV